MKLTSPLLLLAAALGVSAAPHAHAEPPAPATSQLAALPTQPKVKSGEAAIEIARSQIGFLPRHEGKVSVAEVQLTHEGIAFLRKELAGQNAYRVTFENFDLARATGLPALRNRHISTIHVILHPKTGNVLKITSVWPEGLPRIAEFPSADSEERQMGDQRYSGPPEEAPAMTLASAMAASSHWDTDVKQIHAYYVRHTDVTHTDLPVWVVHLRGHGRLPSHLPDDPKWDDALNHTRCIIDIGKRECLSGDTIPQPDSRVEDRY